MLFFTRLRRLATPRRRDGRQDLSAEDRLERVPDEDAAGDGAGDPRDGEAAGEDTGDRRGARLLASRVSTVLACLLVLFALNLPNDFTHLTPEAFLSIPRRDFSASASFSSCRPRQGRWWRCCSVRSWAC
ncbi:hypothetical protein [Allosalinactinospora lopnorensis]|uniref:hypothetical protein n=1 Tax=Allosalinactinospora lopnorensis TaxID=1352348 RepID=UPI00138F3367|nr:hypothetical protein [Allosalinactinospora lopnorensis]